ncbi:hypothetical protein CERSUDRAFT_118114 [Gelatoporia subvermispora B]|uniref:G-protein coupled receptors family 1 profile domain-containing protein n=1 Tax=Ceriporiopsis subvermispora (strain B) TaxID=914234 RepID=M2R3R1_CERS8|nr:hypothetical protein CERSUDRAFT_118114 [Gelatoporia subvermispora B]
MPSAQVFFAYLPGQAQTLIAIVFFAFLSMIAVFHVFFRFSWGSLTHWYTSADLGDEPRERFFFRTQLGAYTASLLLSNFIYSTANALDIQWILIHGVRRGSLCTAQGMIGQISGVANSYFTSAIAIHTFNSLVLRKRLPTWCCGATVTFGWVSAMISGIIPHVVLKNDLDPVYDRNGLSCGFSPEYSVLETVLQLTPIFIASLISVVCFVLIFLFLRGTLSISNGLHVNIDPEARRSATAGSLLEYHRFIAAIARSMLWYPVAYVGLMYPMVIISLASINEISVPFPAMVFANAFAATLGFANAMILLNILRIMAPVLSAHQAVHKIQASTGSESFFAGSKSPLVQEFKVSSPSAARAPAVVGPTSPLSPRTPRSPRTARVPPIIIPSRQNAIAVETVLLAQAVSGPSPPVPLSPRTPRLPTIAKPGSRRGTLQRTGTLVKQLMAKRPSIRLSIGKPIAVERQDAPLLEQTISSVAELNAMLSGPGLPSNPRTPRPREIRQSEGLPPPRRKYRSQLVHESSYEVLLARPPTPTADVQPTTPRAAVARSPSVRSGNSSIAESRTTLGRSRHDSAHDSLLTMYTNRSSIVQDGPVPPVPRLPAFAIEPSAGMQSASVTTFHGRQQDEPLPKAASPTNASDESSRSSADHSTVHLVNASANVSSTSIMMGSTRNRSRSRSRTRSDEVAVSAPPPPLPTDAMRRIPSTPELRVRRSVDQFAPHVLYPRSRTPLPSGTSRAGTPLIGLPQNPRAVRSRTPVPDRAPSAYADPFVTPTHSRQSSKASTAGSFGITAVPNGGQDRSGVLALRVASPSPKPVYGYF